MHPRLCLLAATLSTLASVSAHLDGHDDVIHIESQWQHPDAEVTQLFKRQGGGGLTIGSPAWVATYPPLQGVPSPAIADIPARWLAAYNYSKSTGKIPDIPVTTQVNGGPPTYPNGLVGTDPSICNAALKTCRIPGDIWDAPDGMIGISFDDGPVAIAPSLYQFLRTNSIPATHFMIGRVILGDLDSFNIAFTQNMDSIGVHTWSHPLMTTQTDLQALVEIGWTMQIIHDLTGGRVPSIWRPPLGDMDLRIHAIAKEVFNLTTIIWNQDTEDWRLSLGLPGQYVSGNLTLWLNGSKTPGLIILEHELTNDTVNFFENTTYPLIVKNGWKMANIPDLFALPWYANAAKDTDTPVADTIALAAPTTGPISGTGAAGTGGTGTGTGTSGAAGSTASSGSGKTSGAARVGSGAVVALGALAAALAALA